TLSTLFSQEKYISGKLIHDEESQKLWGFSSEGIGYIEPGKLSSRPKVSNVPIPNQIRKSKSGYENILYVGDNTYLLGTTEGYLSLNLDALESSASTINLNTITSNNLHNSFNSLSKSEDITLKNKDNNLQFTYSVANYDTFSPTMYQYRLDGIYDEWSNWSPESEVLFENLPSGTYEFQARAKVGDILSGNTVSFPFQIERSWFLKPLAIVVYVLSFFGLLLALHYLNRKHYKRQQQKLMDRKQRELELEQLESQRKLVQFKNQNLRLDIENKNRELGIATMNLIKRNELLNNIKEELTIAKSIDEIRDVVKLINRNLNNTDDWKLFEEAFNNADKDFLKKVKGIHPSLTPNDLRLCAYLRLNLTSKEIAPLLNISHKSVEVKRYRLRKKMGLAHDTSLTNYIIEL
ncbi:MAG: triple tyrosine motif-containing protein, partial [Bacteroidota bacterium]